MIGPFQSQMWIVVTRAANAILVRKALSRRVAISQPRGSGDAHNSAQPEQREGIQEPRDLTSICKYGRSAYARYPDQAKKACEGGRLVHQ